MSTIEDGPVTDYPVAQTEEYSKGYAEGLAAGLEVQDNKRDNFIPGLVIGTLCSLAVMGNVLFEMKHNSMGIDKKPKKEIAPPASQKINKPHFI